MRLHKGRTWTAQPSRSPGKTPRAGPSFRGLRHPWPSPSTSPSATSRSPTASPSAVRGGRPADRAPTIEQLVARLRRGRADGRRAPPRVASALALAGVASVPDVIEAAPGQRLTLEVRRARASAERCVAGIVALVLLFAAVAAAATQLDFSDDDTVADLPAGTATTGPTTATNTVTDEPTTSTDQTTSTATEPQPTAAERRRAKRARERRARERRAKARAKARRERARAAARRRVTVRLNASLATFLCVEADGKQAFNGTLTGARDVPRARRAPQRRPRPQHARDGQRQGRPARRQPDRRRADAASAAPFLPLGSAALRLSLEERRGLARRRRARGARRRAASRRGRAACAGGGRAGAGRARRRPRSCRAPRRRRWRASTGRPGRRANFAQIVVRISRSRRSRPSSSTSSRASAASAAASSTTPLPRTSA